MSKIRPVAVAVLAVLLTTVTTVAAEDVSFYGRTNGKDRPAFTRQEPPASSFSLTDVLPASSAGVPEARSAEDKVHPDLKAIRDRGGADRIRVVIELPEHLSMSFPQRDRTKPPDHPVNQAILRQRRERSEQILQARLARNEPVVEGLKALGVSVVEQFWITNSILAEMPVASVDKLAARADVISLAPEHTSVQPPTVRAGRDIIRSDYIGSSAWYHWNYILIALLDTGTALTAQNTTMHTQFDPPNQIGGFDCVNGTNTGCSVGYNLNPADDCWNHGLSTSAIITGNNNLGDTYRGVSNFTLYSFKVYDQNGTGTGCTVGPNGELLGLNTAAAQRGFQAAVNMGLDIIVAEIQDWKGSVLTAAADNAFDAGSAVIAAAGNQPGTSTVRSPGEAHKAIAVGAVDYETLVTESYQGRGPEADGRIKPDIQGPTNTETASNTGYTQLRDFGGTSGSTPYGAVSAAMLSYWLSPYGVAPGHIYAQLINYGRNVTDPTSNNTTGAGLLQLQNGPAENWWGVVSVSAGQTAIVSIPISSTKSVIDAAIWWPEPTTLHNNIDLRLRNPSGTTVRTSASVNSVFEKFRYSATVSTGTWQIRITGATVSGTQQVYYAVQAR